MKRFTMFVLMTVTAGCLMASPDFESIKMQAIQGYKMALASENCGLRNDALHKIARMKSEYPETDLSCFEPILKKMAVKDADAMVRMNAQLTLNYLRDSAISEWVPTQKAETSFEFFNRLYQQMTTIFAAAQ